MDDFKLLILGGCFGVHALRCEILDNNFHLDKVRHPCDNLLHTVQPITP